MYFGGGLDLWREVYDGFGVVPFYAGSSGVQAGGWFARRSTASPISRASSSASPGSVPR